MLLLRSSGGSGGDLVEGKAGACFELGVSSGADFESAKALVGHVEGCGQCADCYALSRVKISEPS